MKTEFQPNGLPALIGSLPLGDHDEALRMVMKAVPDIPLWVQLPIYPEEGMIAQFLPGMPGLTVKDDRAFIDAGNPAFDQQLFDFYEDYLAAAEERKDLLQSRFAMKPDTARGFFVFLDALKSMSRPPTALKGQITGPFTFTVGVKDHLKRAIFYDEQLRDAAVKLLGMKARWQVRQLSRFKRPVMIFFDEPALAGFGSSEFISISREDVAACFKEVIDAVQAEGGLAGIHVCANADWSLIFEAAPNIISFDAYAYFDKFILYAAEVKTFLESGGVIAWGIAPTLDGADIEKETAESLIEKWEDQAARVGALGVDRSRLLAQSLITPSCGTGSLSLQYAKKVLTLTREVSDHLRKTT